MLKHSRIVDQSLIQDGKLFLSLHARLDYFLHKVKPLLIFLLLGGHFSHSVFVIHLQLVFLLRFPPRPYVTRQDPERKEYKNGRQNLVSTSYLIYKGE